MLNIINFFSIHKKSKYQFIDWLTFALFALIFTVKFKSFFVYNRVYNLIGILFILMLAYIFSNNKSAVNGRLIRVALLLHYGLAYAMLKTSIGNYAVESIALFVNQLYMSCDTAIAFLFGKLSDASMPWGFIFAVKVLPIIVFFGAFMSLLFYLGIIKRLVYFINFLIQPLLGTSGAETLCAVSNSFLGQLELLLLISQYLKDMSKSEFLVIMISGMGTISGSILAVFASMGVPAKHLLASSIMAIPATILISKILYPDTENGQTDISKKSVTIDFKSTAKNFLDAIAIGTFDGLQLALNVGAMLISFLSLLAIINAILIFLITKINLIFALSLPLAQLQDIFGIILMPFAWLLGFGGSEAFSAGQLLGIKLSINEMVAYSKMGDMNLSARAISILTYALCGFANFSCIGIQIGGIGALVPEKRAWLSELGFKAVFGATLANLLSAMVAALLI